MSDDISVVIPTYNRFELLKEAIASVRLQRLRVQKIVVVDDGSTDHTVAWCKSQADITLLETQRAGPSAARNIGVRHCNTAWVAFLDSDDVWKENYLEEASEILKAIPESSILISNFHLTDAQLNIKPGAQGFVEAFPAFHKSTRLFSFLFPTRRNKLIWHGLAHQQALLGNWMQPSGLILRRSLFMTVKGFDETLWRCEDMDLLLKLVLQAPVTLRMNPGYLWRQQQPDSLAADGNTLLLKREGLRRMIIRGADVVKRHPQTLLLWCLSISLMMADEFHARILRKAKDFEKNPTHQTLVQSAIALLNMCVPLILARWLPREEFSIYRTFSLYLSSLTALSLTSGLWSLIPYWTVQSQSGAAKIGTAWRIQCLTALLWLLIVFVWSPMTQLPHSANPNATLALAAAVLLPSIFLEQELSHQKRGFLVACVVGCAEALKTLAMMILLFYNMPLSLIIAMIPLFLLLRLAFLIVLSNHQKRRTQKNINHRNEWRTVIKSAAPIGLSAAFATLASIFERLLLSKELSSTAFAGVAAGTLSFPVVSLLEQANAQHSLQNIAHRLFEGDQNGCAEIIKNNITRISHFALPYAMGLCLFSPEIVQLCFFGRYPEAANIMRLFSIGNVVTCIPTDILSRAQGYSKRILGFSFASFVTIAVAVVSGFQGWHIYGAFTATLVAGFVTRLIFFLSELRMNKIPLPKVLPDRQFLFVLFQNIFLILFLKSIAILLKIPPLYSVTILSLLFLWTLNKVRIY